MKLIPFPYGLNVGTDIVHVPRILRLISRSSTISNSYLQRFALRILSTQEQADFRSKFPQSCLSSKQTIPSSSKDIARWLAGRFAAKEAARKAAPGGAATISWKEVIVRADPNGKNAPDVIYAREGGTIGQLGKLSISHDGEYAVATVIAPSHIIPAEYIREKIP